MSAAARHAAEGLLERDRLTLEATIDHAVIRGALIAPSGHRHDFHGWLELNTALEAMLDTGEAAVAGSGADSANRA